MNKLEEILKTFNKKEFKSPFRSTIPLITLFNQNYFERIEIEELRNEIAIKHTFEHKTPVLKGRGFPSCTDLMIEFANHNIAIEAKRTEPKYETVEKWLKDIPNRKLVLEGWLSKINSQVQLKIKINDVLYLPYQLIHRVASACSDGKKAHVLYIGFDLDEKMKEYYIDCLKTMSKITKQKIDLYFYHFLIEKLNEQQRLEECWNSGERDLSESVINGIRKNNLMKIKQEFGKKINNLA